jgi:hypothetical protein
VGREIKVGIILIGVCSTDQGDGPLRIYSVWVIGLGLLHYAVRARDSIPTFKASTGTGRVVAYPLVGAVDLTEIPLAAYLCIVMSQGLIVHIHSHRAISLDNLGPGIVS